ncbi:alginate export family protein [Thalassotalea sp. 1_MG-2023]|uniref:alginate export family protein n=1 Tax=Thalassotalea sp. 1_MG-2023 TaxID=3062680 RepID=UPI0026E3A231|nr:alginate export family protein [Thalassotalea sp. 1_MG-2023]MDO6425816.1 alginate export family protein [Thalassotalea sp. 1_MG-2023]
MKGTTLSLALFSSISLTLLVLPVMADESVDASFDFRLRYESVSQDNLLKNADALTLRTQLRLQTPQYQHFSGFIEFADSRDVGLDHYNDTNGYGTQYSVVADPNTTEVDQAYVQYQNKGVTVKLGRQVIALDNQRFVGHVGWRQDKQTFDAASASYQATDNIEAKYAYVTQRNRIFAEQKDSKAQDHLFNVSINSKLGKLSGYSYLLDADEGVTDSLTTHGVRLAGKKSLSDIAWLYRIEYAKQQADKADKQFSTDYHFAELGATIQGVTIKGGIEILSSDAGEFAFSTPLATLHAFNGWTDQFLATPSVGLRDQYISFNGTMLQGKWALVFHNFTADNASNIDDDLGDELNISYVKKLSKTYSAGIKFAAYSAGNNTIGKVDTDKLWLWLSASF